MADSHHLYQNIFTSLIDGVLIVSMDLKITEGNLSAEEMFQRSRGSFEGQPLFELFPNQSEVLKKVELSLSSGAAYHHVEGIGFRKSTGTFFPTNLTLSPILNTQGQVTHTVVLVQDTTLIKELQESTRQVDYLSSLGVLTDGMAHEIRNPLGGIRGSAQLLLKDLKEREHCEYLKIVISMKH